MTGGEGSTIKTKETAELRFEVLEVSPFLPGNLGRGRFEAPVEVRVHLRHVEIVVRLLEFWLYGDPGLRAWVNLRPMKIIARLLRMVIEDRQMTPPRRAAGPSDYRGRTAEFGPLHVQDDQGNLSIWR